MDADGILAGVARDVWARDHVGEACPDHAIPAVPEFLAWLHECPAGALSAAFTRSTWLTACFSGAMPAAARLDWRREHHTPTARWLAFSHGHGAIGYHVHRAEHGDDAPAALGFQPEAGMMEAAELEALHQAWGAVREPEVSGNLVGWFDVGAEAAAAFAAAWDEAYPQPNRDFGAQTTEDFIARFPELVRKWREVAEKGWSGGVPDGHPLTPLVRAWQCRVRDAAPFRLRWTGSLPRFDRTTVDEARLLASMEAPGPGEPVQGELLHTDDVVDSCATWLLEMFHRAVSVRTGRDLKQTGWGMPWSFTVVIGGLAHFGIADRRVWAPMGRGVGPFTMDEIIGWIHPHGWNNRRRDWNKLDAAFEELPSYRVTVDGYRCWVVAGDLPAAYSPKAELRLTVRVPPSAAYGARFSWPAYRVTYAKRATMQRAVLSTASLLDKTAHRGNPLTRLVRDPVLDADGNPKRERIIGRDGKPARDARGRYRTRPVFVPGKLVPNPLLGQIHPALLPDKHTALFLGMADTRSNRRDAKAALETLNADGVIDLERVPNGFRVFGPSPKPPPVP